MHKHIKRIATHRVSTFAYIGIVNTAADFILFNFLRVATHTTSSKTGSLILLNVISASTIAVFSFFLNRRYVFKSSTTRNHMILPFMLVTLTSVFVLQSLILSVALHSFGPLAQWTMDIVQSLKIPVIRNFSFSFYETNIAKVCATAASMVWNYLWYSKAIFKEK
jgi:putative flippase GtrA